MKIGFIGLGIMGESMCENIVKKHNDKVFCNDLNRNQVAKLAGVGAIPCENNIEVAKNADVIISMVPKSEHVRALYTELLPYITADKICIDMSTIDPSVSREVAGMVKAKGAQFADAPVVKSKPAAIAGTLGIYAGCDESLFPVIEPILRYMGCNVIRMGTAAVKTSILTVNGRTLKQRTGPRLSPSRICTRTLASVRECPKKASLQCRVWKTQSASMTSAWRKVSAKKTSVQLSRQ